MRRVPWWPWKTLGVSGRREVIAEGGPRILLLASFFVAVAAVVAGFVVGYFVREPWVLFTFETVWLGSLLVRACSRRCEPSRGVLAWRIGFNAVRGSVWFAFNTLP